MFCTTIGDKGRRKFVERVQQIAFSAARALRSGQEILYVTERAVLALTEHGLTLREIAPGLDVRCDLLDQVGCAIHVPDDVTSMPASCFAGARAPYPATNEN